MELLVNVGLIDSISQKWPQVVQDNWAERLENLDKQLQQEIVEVQNFAEAFDDPK